MAYDINRTNGSLLITLADGQVDTTQSSLSLIGRNVSVYGELINENLVKLLENFSNSSAPSNPLSGQLWYDSASRQLKLYNDTTWQGINTYIKSATAPSGLEVGDLWFDTTTGRVSIREASGFRLLGPIAGSGFGDTKLIAEIFESSDSSGNHEVLSLFIEGTRLVVFSDDAQYATSLYDGFGTVKPGININTVVSDAVFNGTATNAQQLNSLSSGQFMRSDVDATNTGNVTVGKLIAGSGSQTALTNNTVTGYGAGSGDFTVLSNGVNNIGLSLRAQYFGSPKDFVVVDSGNNRVVIDSDLLVTGSFNAATASALANTVTIGLTGNVTGNVSFNGTGNAIISTTFDTERLKITGGTMTGLLNADQGFRASGTGTANLIVATGSRVGILNADPQVALDVVGSIRTVPVVSGSSSGTITLNAQNSNHQVNLTASASIAFTNFTNPGQIVRIVLVGTENTVTWGSTVYWPNGVAPNLSNGTYKIAVVTLMKPNIITPSGPRPDADFILATYVSY
jgi:hypothetical protein